LRFLNRKKTDLVNGVNAKPDTRYLKKWRSYVGMAIQTTWQSFSPGLRKLKKPFCKIKNKNNVR
jgi:hypothetical protein